jgi:hypothetical protein
MSNGLKDKLDEFIQGIKSKLPGKSDEDEYDEDEYEEEFDEKTEEIDLKKKNADLDEDDLDEDEDEDLDEDDDEAATAAKKKQNLIRGLIAVICLYLAYDTFMVTPEPPIQAPVVKRKKRKKRVKKKSKVNKVAKDKKQKTEVVTKKEDVEIPVPEKVEQKAAVVEKAKIEPIVKEVVKPIVKEEVKPIVKEEVKPIVKEVPEEISLKPEDKEDITLGEMTQKPKKEENKIDKALDNLSDNTPKMIENVKRKKLEYTEPPSYQDTGKGLVYNCSGKHWACVDKASYLNCKKNSDWSKENKKSPECYPSDVYQSFNDCRIIQVDKINTLAKTSFCK